MKGALAGLVRSFTVVFVAGLMTVMMTACENRPVTGNGSIAANQPVVPPPVPSAAVVSGRVASGDYLGQARVFLDRNGNRRYDQGEPLDVADDKGLYTLFTNPGEGDRYAVLSTAGDKGDTPLRFLLESPPEYGTFVSPLTTLVNLEMEKNPTINVNQAQWRIKQWLGLADNVSLFADYVLLSQAGHDLRKEYLHAVTVAEIVAALFTYLYEALEKNTGTEVSTVQRRAAAFLVSDKVMRHGTVIRDALNNERNRAIPVNGQKLTDEIKGKLDVNRLNADLLEEYIRRLEQRSEFWDGDPPRLQSVLPVAGAVATINAAVTLVFDRALDRERLAPSGTIVVTGPQGVVAGTLSYNAELGRLRFVPDQLLEPLSSYHVEVSADIYDLSGNRFGQRPVWTFSTTFDQKPPNLALPQQRPSTEIQPGKTAQE